MHRLHQNYKYGDKTLQSNDTNVPSSSSPPIGIAFPPPLGELPPTSRLPRLPLAMNSDDDEGDAVDDDMMWWCADGEKPRAVAGRRRRAMDLFIVAAGVGGVFAVWMRL
jgi:hypothetical protein